MEEETFAGKVVDENMTKEELIEGLRWSIRQIRRLHEYSENLEKALFLKMGLTRKEMGTIENRRPIDFEKIAKMQGRIEL